MTSNIPKLRFEVFEGEWNIKKAGEIFIDISNKKHNGDLPLLAVTQDQGIVKRENLSLKINSSIEGIKNYKIIEPGDFVISLRSFQGGIEFSKIRGISSPAYTILKNKINIYSLFYAYLFKKESFIKRLNSLIYGIRDGKQISYSEFSTLKLPYPEYNEQQKIAEFLESADSWIENLKDQKKSLEIYKKGMMQKIFAQEIRFKDENGKEFEEWNKIKLEEILYEHKDRNTENKYIEVFSVAKEKGVINQIEHLGRVFASNNLSNYKIMYDNDIAYTKSPTSNFPYGIIKQNLTKRIGLVSPLYAIFTPKNKYLGKLLHLYFLSWKNTYNYLNPLVQKGAKNTININNNDFLNGSRLLLPISEKEQQKNVDFLTSIDKLLESKQRQIVKAEEWKKGLMQGLFV